MTAAEYFALPNSPAPNSPVGALMRKIMAAEITSDFEAARKIASQAVAGKGGHDRLRQAWQTIILRFPHAKNGSRGDFRWALILSSQKTKRDRARRGEHHAR